jgi:meso-butanediol dehydrogenase / (S,S)-butanediol dehydrogenase / diacetyl reductase
VKAPLATPEDLRETVRRCEALGRRVVSSTCDVRDQGQVDAAVALAIAELGQIDVLINNAGVSSPIGRAWELDEDQWRVVLDIDLDGAWRCAKAVAPHMIERRSGCILNTASAAGLKGLGSNAAYITAKHGLIGLTRSLALEGAKKGVTVNAICPSWTETRMLDEAVAAIVAATGRSEAEARAAVLASSPLGRAALPEEVADLAVLLASSPAITGQSVHVDGGEVMA